MELCLSLQRFVMNPIKARLNDVKEEIADRIVTSEGMVDNAKGSLEDEFKKHFKTLEQFLKDHNLYETYQNILDKNRESIRKIIEQKIDRTTNRIKSGHYDR
jgi:F0F1-type ATP synthase membrane subunit b/b'